MISSGRGPTEGGGEGVADVRDKKRKRAAWPPPGGSDSVGARRSVCPGPRRPGTTAPLLLGQLPTGADSDVSPAAGLRVGMKVELTGPPDAHGVGAVREYSRQAVPSHSWSSAGSGRRPSISSCVVSTGP
ncbi:unnamed protein product, partial [Sphacelaria rigidula]